MPDRGVMVRGVPSGAVFGLLFMMKSGAVLAGSDDGALRFACVGPEGADAARLEAMCRAVGTGIAETLGRELQLADPAQVVLEIIRLETARAVARLRWGDAAPGPEVEVGTLDIGLNERAFRMMAEGLLKHSPPP